MPQFTFLTFMISSLPKAVCGCKEESDMSLGPEIRTKCVFQSKTTVAEVNLASRNLALPKDKGSLITALFGYKYKEVIVKKTPQLISEPRITASIR